MYEKQSNNFYVLIEQKQIVFILKLSVLQPQDNHITI